MARAKASFSVRLEGADAIARRAERVGGDVKRAVELTIKKYATKIEREAKRLAPVDTGRLRASIHKELRGLTAEVIASTDYAAFQEFGTGRRGAQSGVETPSGYDYGPSRGVSAQPYMRPALERHRAGFVRDLKATLNKHV